MQVNHSSFLRYPAVQWKLEFPTHHNTVRKTNKYGFAGQKVQHRQQVQQIILQAFRS